MIPDSVIFEEIFRMEISNLKEVLNSLSMTAHQREEIEDAIDSIEKLFKRANK